MVPFPPSQVASRLVELNLQIRSAFRGPVPSSGDFPPPDSESDVDITKPLHGRLGPFAQPAPTQEPPEIPHTSTALTHDHEPVAVPELALHEETETCTGRPKAVTFDQLLAEATFFARGLGEADAMIFKEDRALLRRVLFPGPNKLKIGKVVDLYHLIEMDGKKRRKLRPAQAQAFFRLIWSCSVCAGEGGFDRGICSLSSSGLHSLQLAEGGGVCCETAGLVCEPAQPSPTIMRQWQRAVSPYARFHKGVLCGTTSIPHRSKLSLNSRRTERQGLSWAQLPSRLAATRLTDYRERKGAFSCVSAFILRPARRHDQFKASGDRQDILALDGNAKLHRRTCGMPFAELLPSKHVHSLLLRRCSLRPHGRDSLCLKHASCRDAPLPG